MRKITLLLAFVLAACQLKPNDFPPRPPEMTVIVEFPQATPAPSTPTPAPQIILSADMDEAETFFLILKTSTAAGDDRGVAARVRYPIQAKVNGQVMTIHNADEFVKNYTEIFNETILNALATGDETDLSNLSEGIRFGNGALWIGLFCLDAACQEPVFLITAINN